MTALMWANPTPINCLCTPVPTNLVSLGNLIFNHPQPPKRGRPGNRHDSGSRGEDLSLGLKVLVPTREGKWEVTPGVFLPVTNVWGLTTQAYPTFWFYVPRLGSGTTLQLSLQDEDGREIYQGEVAIPQQPGVISMTVPKTVAPLEVGNWYQYYLRANLSNGESRYVRAWVQRIQMEESEEKVLADGSPSQKLSWYGEKGIWYEMLGELGRLYRSHPQEFEGSWRNVLSAIGMEEVGDYPIVD